MATEAREMDQRAKVPTVQAGRCDFRPQHPQKKLDVCTSPILVLLWVETRELLGPVAGRITPDTLRDSERMNGKW